MDENLSEGQKEYFKHSKARDSNGNLFPVYHGSGTKIEAFDPAFTGQGTDQYGSGFYFTTSRKGAEIYTSARNKDLSGNEIPKLGGEDTPTIVEAYINVENPIILNGYEQANLSHILIPNDKVYDIVKKMPTLYHTMDNEKEPNPLTDYSEKFWEVNPTKKEEFEPLIKEMCHTHFHDTDLQDLDIFFGKYGTVLRTAIHDEMGYDGVIVNFEDNRYYEDKDVHNLCPQHTDKLMDIPMKEKNERNEIIMENEKIIKLRVLAKDEDEVVRAGVAKNESTPPEVLAELAKDKDRYVRAGVAENKSTPSDVLVKLAKDEHWVVQEWVAWNINTPVEVLAELAKDEDVDMRVGVANNRNASPETLAELAEDEKWSVKAEVAENKNTPSETLAKLANDESWRVRYVVAENRSTPPEVLAELAKDEVWVVREGVVGNESTPPEVLTKLAKDEVWIVRENAICNPHYKAIPTQNLSGGIAGAKERAVSKTKERSKSKNDQNQERKEKDVSKKEIER